MMLCYNITYYIMLCYITLSYSAAGGEGGPGGSQMQPGRARSSQGEPGIAWVSQI